MIFRTSLNVKAQSCVLSHSRVSEFIKDSQTILGDKKEHSGYERELYKFSNSYDLWTLGTVSSRPSMLKCSRDM